LIFVREVGAIDNPTYRQMSDTDSMKSTTELRQLREFELLNQKGKGRGTYYIAGKLLITQGESLTTHGKVAIAQGEENITHDESLITHGKEPITHAERPITHGSLEIAELPTDLRAEVDQIGIRASKENLSDCIIKLCKWRELTAAQLSGILDKGENHIRREYLKPLIDDGKIQYKYPDMIKHPNQAYKTIVE
jgi:ATP-dependent DNA helicase RecG